MIQSKSDLIEYIASDNPWFSEKNIKSSFLSSYLNYPAKELKRYLRYLRKQEYYINTARGSFLKGKLGLFYERKKNKLGNQLGIDIAPNCFEKGLHLEHIGTIIINPKARIGANCVLHGNNCIGNNGIVDEAPKIGNNVDIGFGAVVIGDVTIADDIVIGANAVVNRSFLEKGCVIAGVPAKVVKRR